MQRPPIRSVCFDWGGTLMSELGPQDRAMCYWPEVQVLEGALECVQSLHGRFTLCIATNASISGQREIRLALQRGGLAAYFDHVFCHLDLGLKKNQPGYWQAVARVLAHPLEEVAMVGDSQEHDALAPRRFGVQAYWLNPLPARKDEAVPQVRNLVEFARLVLAA